MYKRQDSVHIKVRENVVCTDYLNFLTWTVGHSGSVIATDSGIWLLIRAKSHTQLGSSFTCVCCPGHVGNEEADAAARHAPGSPEVYPVSIRPDDPNVATTATIINVWQQMRNSHQTKLSAVKLSLIHI